jgi:phosphate-selective porin
LERPAPSIVWSVGIKRAAGNAGRRKLEATVVPSCTRQGLMKSLSALLVAVFLIFPAMSLGQRAVDEQDADESRPVAAADKPIHFEFKNRPSIRIGEIANVDIKTKWHFDFRGFDPPKWNPPAVITALPETPPTFYLTRARVGLKGNVTKYFDYEIERDLRETVGNDHEWHPWKDNYVNVHLHRLLQVQIGKFKMPFGMEANLPEDRLDYAFESRTSDTLSPGRERGLMLHARVLKAERLEYQIGVFRYDGEGSDIHGQPTGTRTYAARLTGEPLRSLKPLPKTIRHIYLGVAATRGKMIDGLNGVNGQTFSNFTYFDHVYVHGQRTRFGTEVAWREGPVSIKGEYIHMSEERKGQGIRGEDLPDKISRGWDVMGTFAPLGKMKSNGRPENPLFTGHGFGAVEFTGRFDVLTFFSGPGPGLPSRSPRAPTILPNGERTWTFGPTWYLNRYLKIQAHAQREKLTDIERKAVLGINTFWTGIIRVQVAM